jgi:hypothetical protein
MASIKIHGIYDSFHNAYSFKDKESGQTVQGFALLVQHTQDKELDLDGNGKMTIVPIDQPVVIKVPKHLINSELIKTLLERKGKEQSFNVAGFDVDKAGNAFFTFESFADMVPKVAPKQ